MRQIVKRDHSLIQKAQWRAKGASTDHSRNVTANGRVRRGRTAAVRELEPSPVIRVFASDGDCFCVRPPRTLGSGPHGKARVLTGYRAFLVQLLPPLTRGEVSCCSVKTNRSTARATDQHVPIAAAQ